MTDAGSRFSPEGAVRLLLDRGLLTLADAVTRDVTVFDVPGRNHNLTVTVDDGRGWFIKRAMPGQDTAPLDVEAAIYRAASGRAAAVTCATLVQRMVLFDAPRRVLVLELLPDAWTAHDWPGRDEPDELARFGDRLAFVLAAWHSAALPLDDVIGAGDADEPARPWGLALHRPALEALREISPAQLRLVAALQANALACVALERLRQRWTPSAVIHGDVKWSNVLVVPAPHADWPEVRLVDWESAVWGDPAWDVGSMWHAFLLDGLGDGTDDADTPDDAATAFAARLPAAQLGIASSWRRYRGASTAANEPAFAHRAVLASGARLVQTAWEACFAQEAVPRTAAATLQLGLNILAHPADAAARLLGIDAVTPTD